MDLEERAAKFTNVKWNDKHTSFIAVCPGSNGKPHNIACGPKTSCLGYPKCSDELIGKFFANGTAKLAEVRGAAEAPRANGVPPDASVNVSESRRKEATSRPRAEQSKTSDDILRRLPPQNIEAEQSVLGAILLENSAIEEAIRTIKTTDLYREAHRMIFDAMLTIRQMNAPIDAITLCQELTTRHQLEQIGGPAYIAELAMIVPTARHIEHYARIVRDMAVKRDIGTRATHLASLAYDGVSVDALLGEVERTLQPVRQEAASTATEIIPWEEFDDAVIANEEYLKRTPVIDKLCYSSAVSMITGGKHAGKSTLARWMAICVAKGYDFLHRSVYQGPVLYIASEDETMAARQELIRLGWTRSDRLRFLSSSKAQIQDQKAFLVRLTTEIAKMRAVLVIVDMLFDFVPIADEMSYAGTREAVGLMQAVASGSGTHVVAIHHAPKNANIGDATVAALGSQGLAARVSPIILVRRFGPGVHSISSTGVRDPRGESIPDSRLIRNDDGSVELGGAFKNYMLAEVYVPRVKEMLEDDPGAEMTAPEVAEALTISYEVARSCLSNMCRNGIIQRTGSGKKGKPYRYSVANTSAEEPGNPTSTGQVGYSEQSENDRNQGTQQPFAYKD